MTGEISTGTDHLLAPVDGNVGGISFGPAERRNALSDPIYHAFQVVLPQMAIDPDARVLMLTGMRPGHRLRSG